MCMTVYILVSRVHANRLLAALIRHYIPHTSHNESAHPRLDCAANAYATAMFTYFALCSSIQSTISVRNADFCSMNSVTDILIFVIDLNFGTHFVLRYSFPVVDPRT